MRHRTNRTADNATKQLYDYGKRWCSMANKPKADARRQNRPENGTDLETCVIEMFVKKHGSATIDNVSEPITRPHKKFEHARC